MNKTKLHYVTFEYSEPIVYVNFNEPAIIDKEQLLKLIEIRNRLADYKPHLVLTTFNSVVDFTDDARKAAAIVNNTSTSIAHAVVVKWLGQRLVTGTYKEIDKPHYPLEIFSEKNKAEKWLLTHLPIEKKATL